MTNKITLLMIGKITIEKTICSKFQNKNLTMHENSLKNLQNISYNGRMSRRTFFEVERILKNFLFAAGYKNEAANDALPSTLLTSRCGSAGVGCNKNQSSELEPINNPLYFYTFSIAKGECQQNAADHLRAKKAFRRALRAVFNVGCGQGSNYLWVAESEPQLHFHMITDLNEAYFHNMEYNWLDGLSDFQFSRGNASPLCACSRLEDFAVIPYILKQHAPIDVNGGVFQNSYPLLGRVWGCSRSMFALKPVQSEVLLGDNYRDYQNYTVAANSPDLRSKMITLYRAALGWSL
jgi:hypothetical protein